MILSSEGMEKAAKAYDDALNNPLFVDCRKCQGTGYHHGFGETGHDPDWCLDCGGSKVVLATGEDARPLKSAISAYLSALPPVDGLEVVGHVKPEHPEVVEPLFVRELSQPWMEGIFTVPVVTLSQASSVIAGLTAERDEARGEIERMTPKFVAYDYLESPAGREAAEARISSLEEEIKRLRDVLGSAYEHIEQLSELLKIIKEHWVDYDHIFSISVHEADEFLAARQELGDHNG